MSKMVTNEMLQNAVNAWLEPPFADRTHRSILFLSRLPTELKPRSGWVESVQVVIDGMIGSKVDNSAARRMRIALGINGRHEVGGPRRRISQSLSMPRGLITAITKVVDTQEFPELGTSLSAACTKMMEDWMKDHGAEVTYQEGPSECPNTTV